MGRALGSPPPSIVLKGTSMSPVPVLSRLLWIPVCVPGALLFFQADSASAQRHPESQGALSYYRDDPTVLVEPAWKRRPAFLRGPLDRMERGRSRRWLGTEDAVSYLNYAQEKYILYQRELTPWAIQGGRPFKTRNVHWDRVGNYMGGGYQRVFSIEESRSNATDVGFSYVDHKFHTMRIGHYSYKDLHWTMTVGGVGAQKVRTIFTPLTLTQTQMSVARLDLDYLGRDRATVLYSRGGRVGTNVLFSQWALASGDDSFDEAPVMVYGGHWQRDVGDYMTFGTSFVNQILNDASSARSDAWRGDLSYDMLGPRSIFVHIADDSPLETRANARTYGVDIFITGERDGEPVKLSSQSDASGFEFDSRLEATVSGGRTITGGGREAVVYDDVIYEFAIPEDISVVSARFVADVADDYRIGIRQIHDYPGVDRDGNLSLFESEWPVSFDVLQAASRRPFKWAKEEEENLYYTVVRSSGKASAGGNRKLVSFDYGMPTGQNLASFNFAADLVGLEIQGEVARNLQNFIYPVGTNLGDRHKDAALAYWFKGLKDLPSGFSLGGELFRMEPDYAGGYDSWRGGMAFHLDQQSGRRVNSFTQEYPLLEDNDDNDQWPDEHASENPTPGDLYPGWPNSSVYPGLDLNSDNIPDPDRNENFIPDWEEAFLTYVSEPPDFVYGIDLNNNAVPDFRENDDQPDFPYPKDQKGYHLFLGFERLGAFGKNLSIGRYDTRQVAGGGESKAVYLRYSHDYENPGIFSLRVNYDVKQVQDDILDHTFVWIVPPDDVNIVAWINQPDGPPWSEGLFRPATPDSLFMRDSSVHTGFIDTRFGGIGGLNFDNALLWIRNSQAEIPGFEEGDPLVQPEDVRSKIALVNKADYTRRFGSWELVGKFKHRLRHESLETEEGARVNQSEFIPIATAEYSLTAGTQFLFGAQGIPFVPYKMWNRADENGSFTQTDYLAMVKITAEYFGISGNNLFMGYQRTNRKFDKFSDRDFKSTTLFVELVSPF